MSHMTKNEPTSKQPFSTHDPCHFQLQKVNLLQAPPSLQHSNLQP